MTPLSLAPLPSSRTDDASPSAENNSIGFVDEAVVARMLSPSSVSRVDSCPEDLALAADDMDFAGWQLAPTATPSSFRITEDLAEVPPLSFRRATPPAILDFNIGPPHDGAHRWWIAGLAGFLTTLLATLLLLSLSSRTESEIRPIPSPAAATQPGLAIPPTNSPR